MDDVLVVFAQGLDDVAFAAFRTLRTRMTAGPRCAEEEEPESGKNRE